MYSLFGGNKKTQNVEVTVTNKTLVRVVFVIIISYIGLLTVRKASHAFILIFIAIFFALALNAPVQWLSGKIPGKRRGSRTIATSISFLFIVLLFAGFVASIVPPLVKQTGNFIDATPQLIDDIHNQDTGLGKFVRKYKLDKQVDKFSSQLSSRLNNIANSLVGAFSRVTGSIFSTLTVLVFTFMMLIEGPRWVGLAKRLLPKERREKADLLATDMYKVVKGYVNGQIILAALAAVVIFVPLVILNVSYPIALMVVVFFCGLIPLVGHTLGAIIVSSVALLQSPLTAIIILMYYIIYQQIENYIMQPRIQANTTNMTPMLVFIAVVIGINFNGLLGGLLAIPIAACMKVLVKDYVQRHNLLYQPEAKDDAK